MWRIYVAGKDPGVMSVMRRCVWDLCRREGPWSDIAHDVQSPYVDLESLNNIHSVFGLPWTL